MEWECGASFTYQRNVVRYKSEQLGDRRQGYQWCYMYHCKLFNKALVNIIGSSLPWRHCPGGHRFDTESLS